MTVNKNIAAFITRLIIGGVFIFAGWSKISAITHTIGFFGQLGLAPFLAYIVGYVEFFGGILLVLGLFIEASALILAVVMAVAVYLLKGGGFEGVSSPLETLAALIAIAGLGSGKYAVRFRKNKE